MNVFLATFKISFKGLWKSPSNVVILIVFPILLILVLGNALGSYIAPDGKLNTVPAAVVTGDSSSNFSQFLKSEEISRFIDTTFTDDETATKLLETEEVGFIVYEKNADISLKKTNTDDIYITIAISVIESYKQISTAAEYSTDYSKIPEIIAKNVKVNEMPLNNKFPSAIDYYSVTMLVMILMYTGLNGAELFKKGLFNNTGERIRISPASTGFHIAGMIAASTITSYLQGMITFLFSAVVYGTYWGEKIPLVLLTLLGVVLFSQSFCIFLVMAFKNENTAMWISQVLTWIMTFLSKGYSKMSFGDADKIFEYVPNALAHTVIFGSIYGSDEKKMFISLCILFSLSIFLFLFAFLLGKRRFV